MDSDLKPTHDLVMQALRPEDAFKELTVLLPPRLLEKHLTPEMEQMRAVLDKERYSSYDDKASAEAARTKLEQLHADALVKAEKGLYALDDFTPTSLPSGGKSIVVGDTVYAVGERFHVGQHSTLFKGRMKIDHGSGGVVLRVSNAASENPYLFNEIRMLDLLRRNDVGYWRNIPFMLDRFSAGERVGIIYRYFEGVTLTTVRTNRLHRDGLDQRHVVWVMDRLLGLLGYVHSLGIIHGRIDPERVRVRPGNHNALLTGWGHAVYRPAVTREGIVPNGGMFEAPEIGDSNAIGPWTDIYSLGKTLIWLIGGDPVTNEMPDSVEPKLRQFLLNMVRKSPRARPNDAWQLYKAQNRLKDSLWERRFLPLNLA